MGLFGNLFSKRAACDLSVVHTDMHSHFLFGLDDGAKTIEDSVQLIKGMYDLGYRKLITTPHIMGDYYQNSRETIEPVLEKVREALVKENIGIELHAAAEYYLDSEFSEKLKQGNLLTFGNNLLLVEVSYLNAPDNLSEMIFQIQMAGLTPVLAHPERYPFWYNTFEKYHELKDKGVLLQLNINSLTGHYSPATKKIAERMIKEGIVDLIGSDCHHSGHLSLTRKAREERSLQNLLESGKLLNPTL
jgi:protein-tyrosine phosphatase